MVVKLHRLPLIPLLGVLWISVKLSSADIPVFQLERSGVLRKIRIDKVTDQFETTKNGLHSVNPPFKVRRRRSVRSGTFDGSSPDSKIGSSSKSSNKRRHDASLGLDLLIVTDHSIYQYFLITNNKNDTEALVAIYDYFSSILSELTKMYSSKRLGRIKFNIYPVGIIVSKNFQDAPWILAATRHNDSGFVKRRLRPRSLDAYDVLSEFRHWVKKEGENLPEHDHAISITRYDLTRFKDKRAQGIAYVKSICKLGDSVSIVEDVGAMATAAIAGHELAHRALKDETECLRHSPLEKIGYFGLVEQQSLYPGQKVDVDKQCQHAFGKNYRFCDKDGSFAKEMCKQLWCKNANSNTKDKHCSTKSYLPALTGTSCGHKMWCVNGACVEDENAPSQKGCHLGDRDATFCKNLIISDPRKCDGSHGIFARFCCHTCKIYKLTRRKYRH